MKGRAEGGEEGVIKCIHSAAVSLCVCVCVYNALSAGMMRVCQGQNGTALLFLWAQACVCVHYSDASKDRSAAAVC